MKNEESLTIIVQVPGAREEDIEIDIDESAIEIKVFKKIKK